MLGRMVTPGERRLAISTLMPACFFASALVRTAKGEEDVDVTLVGDVWPGDLVLVHAGAAITRLDDLPGVPRLDDLLGVPR